MEASTRRSHSPGSLRKCNVYRGSDFPSGTCPRCGKTDHRSADCLFKEEATCRFCQKSGHLEAESLKKRERIQQVKPISKHWIQTVKAIETVPQLQQSICIQDKEFGFLKWTQVQVTTSAPQTSGGRQGSLHSHP